jgi:hypothetical protein
VSVLSRFVEQLKTGFGSARQPAISPLEDPRTGFFFEKGVVGISAGGAEVSRLSRDGETMKQPSSIIDDTRLRTRTLFRVMTRDDNNWGIAIGNRDYDEQGALVAYQDPAGQIYFAQQNKAAGHENNALFYYLAFGGTLPYVQFLSALAVAGAALTLANGANQNVAIPAISGFQNSASSLLRISGPTGAFSLGGLVPLGIDGQLVFLDCQVAQTFTLNNEDASSTPANRISHTAGNLVVQSALLQYDLPKTRWRILSALLT